MNENEQRKGFVSLINYENDKAEEFKIIQEVLDAGKNQNYDSELSNKEIKTYVTIVKENLKDVTDEVFELYKTGFIPLTPIQKIDIDGKPYLCQTVCLTRNQISIDSLEIDSDNING